ncbi:acyl-CoA synthetase [Aquibaculum arenosum]|uniref:Acyl-CoA synthetase n=1 Tax=Aquibaculum arenosum TaxID=3032591 RepID=A0ABT5YI13_9PROT|nr:acyl-CoA synthetase [Fodinicurvata sp. CAU 1616]MDF2094577.1 acyl-CoA synthetase [Fodinicurvata sp. CAU 1616]
MNPFEQDLDRNSANYVPLSPLSFLPRTAAIYPQRTAVVHGRTSFTWAEAYERCRRLASALADLGVSKGDTVAVMAPNTPPMWEAHHAVPMLGAVLNALNVRLDARTIAFILAHGEAKVLITDTEFHPTISEALKLLGRDLPVIDIDDPQGPGGERLGQVEYEDFLVGGDPDYAWDLPEDEWNAIALNYTSGTTGDPKGVVYHHRGAYLNALGNAMVWSLPPHPVYLWTLPMFHCNGWCFPWTITAVAGTHVCLRRVEAKAIYDAFADHGVTHLCGAPVVMQLILGVRPEDRRDYGQKVQMMTAAAPPPASVLAAMEEQGIEITHVYGLTEVYGPAVVCAWHDDWSALSIEEQAELKARQGAAYPVLEQLMVGDPETLEPVPADGQTMGEVFMRGNIVMKGYFKNPSASERAFAGGWFHSGDLGVVHPDGYVQLKDRSKDIIISGGENISSIEVEDVLYKHAAVAAVAVVAKADERWGETPCAFVELKPGATVEAEELIAFCRERLAHFKCPRHVVFGELPKTSTGKIQKFTLRDRAGQL